MFQSAAAWFRQPREKILPGDRRLRFLYNGATPDIELVSGKPLTRAGTRVASTGPDGIAGSFNGSSQALSFPLDLSDVKTAITAVALIDIRSYSGSYNMLWEFTADGQTTLGGFGAYADNANTRINNVCAGAPGFSGASIDTLSPRPTGRHVLVVVYDHTLAATDRVTVWLDGVLATTSDLLSTALGAGFANSTLYIGARTASTLWADMGLYGFALIEGALSGGEIVDVSRNFWRFAAPAIEDIPDAASGVSGTFSATLNGDTITASGAAPNNSTGSFSLAGDTLSASGTTTILSSAAFTLAGDTISASGTTTVLSSAGLTLGGDTISASGAVGNNTNGTAAFTLNGDTISASGTVTVTSSAAFTLDGVTISASGTTTVLSTAAFTLAGVTMSASGSGGTSSFTFPACAIYVGGNIAIGTNGQPVVIIF